MAHLQHETSASIGGPALRADTVSISAHPMFPMLVALWFAALFGLGMLVLPAAILERMVAASQIGAVLSAANPPLGFTARVLMALSASGLGAAAGLWLARKVAALQADRTSDGIGMLAQRARAAGDSGAESKVRRPLFASEDLGFADFSEDAFLASPVPEETPEPARSRRHLAMPEILSGTADCEPYDVPLPGVHPTDAFLADEPALAGHSPVMETAREAEPFPVSWPVDDLHDRARHGDRDMSAAQGGVEPGVPVAPPSAMIRNDTSQNPSKPDQSELNDIRAADPADLGIFGLVERLRIALEARAQAEARATPDIIASGPHMARTQGAEGAAAIAAIASAPIAPDGGLQSFFAQINTLPSAPALDEDDEDPFRDMDGEDTDDAFGSLLDMPAPGRMAQDEAGQSGWAEEDPEDTDRALRDALATLRQISGAA